VHGRVCTKIDPTVESVMKSFYKDWHVENGYNAGIIKSGEMAKSEETNSAKVVDQLHHCGR